MGKKNFKHEKTGSWVTINTKISDKDLIIGCLHRIADALEKIVDRTELMKERDGPELWDKVKRLKHCCAAYKGIIKKMKGKS